jgi:hypothetical protein
MLMRFGGGSNGTFKLRRTIRVTFLDGSSADVDSDIRVRQVHKLAGNRTIDCWAPLDARTHVGATVPMRYQESDHSRVVLDLPALITELLTNVDATRHIHAADEPRS